MKRLTKISILGILWLMAFLYLSIPLQAQTYRSWSWCVVLRCGGRGTPIQWGMGHRGLSVHKHNVRNRLRFHRFRGHNPMIIGKHHVI